jgi:pyruvate kinase
MTAHEKPAEATPPGDVQAALKSLRFLRQQILSAPAFTAELAPVYRRSADNLQHYLALRRHDIRLLQRQLAGLGLSSLGRCESDVLASVTRVINVLELMAGESSLCPVTPVETSPLGDHSNALFGPPARGRDVRIMVTMPAEAADDYAFVEQLVAAGMNCQRINCAHDGPEQWLKMIEHVRAASQALRLPCLVAMDLPGPKLRTGAIAPGPCVLKVKPIRTGTGQVLKAGQVYLHRVPGVSNGLCAELPADVAAGDRATFTDARGASRVLEVSSVDDHGCWVTLEKTAYFAPGLALSFKRRKGLKGNGVIAGVPPQPQTILLAEGDTLMLTADDRPGTPAVRDDSGAVITPAQVSCTSPAVFLAVQPGDPIWFDDGKIGGTVDAVTPDTLRVSIHHAPGGIKLKADKGINLPGTDLGLDALGEDDLRALEFASQHADIVELSFVNRAQDVHLLSRHLQRLSASDLGVVLKIETRQGFERLPELLLAGMHGPRFGVMIARGDLAVEAGFERTAEVQEQILCLCEAAHVPVIWATQVLETQARTGSPTRAEITDAAMSVRADCVMLNKGPYILKAVATLDDLLRRMRGHHDKKRDLMRRLQVAEVPAQV